MAVERDTLKHQQQRREFCELLTLTSAHRFVFLDESFCRTGMRRDYGWSLRGERVFGSRPARTWKTLTLIGGVRLGERPLLMTHDGPVNAKVFLRFVKRRLARMLRPGDIVVMDNLASHKTAAVKRALLDLGVVPLYLPTYSPELNPIELWWAHVKRQLRSLAIDARDDLARAVRRLRAGLPIRHIDAWFKCAFRHSQIN